MARALGTTDAVTTCDCCGKSGLKLTVAIELDGGDLVHYGTTCASRNTGKPAKQINAEIRTEAARILRAASDEYRASAAYTALMAKLKSRPASMLGLAAMAYIAAEDEADTVARRQIAAKFGLQPYQVHA